MLPDFPCLTGTDQTTARVSTYLPKQIRTLAIHLAKMMMSCQHPEHGIRTGGVVPGESSQPEHTTCTGDFVCLLDSQSNHAIFGAINKIHYWQHRNSPRWIPYQNAYLRTYIRYVTIVDVSP